MPSGKPFFSAVSGHEGSVAVMCLEDDFAMQQVLEVFIAGDSTVTVWMAACSADALDIIDDEGCLPDLILLDHQLQGETGVEAAKAIRDEHGTDIPMVLCSACDASAAVALQAACHCAAFLAKPYTQADVLQAIQQHAVGKQQG